MPSRPEDALGDAAASPGENPSAPDPGASAARACLHAIYRYPVKGLTPEMLSRAMLVPGETLPFDRAYAIENGRGRFDAENPRHLPKTNFLMLMRNERLATVHSRFEDASETLTLSRHGRQVARGQLTSALGRRIIEQFVAAYMAADLRGPPKIVRAPGHSFSDVAAKCVHIVNLESVRALARAIGRPVDPLRFRANLYLAGIAPWSELAWVGKSLRVGAAQLGVFARTGRCDATNVDPATGARDLAIPAALVRLLGHADFGVYATVKAAGDVSPGVPVEVPAR